MSRVQLALNVSDIDQAVGFYTKLFGAEPAKRRPGYANFTLTEPPLKPEDGPACCASGSEQPAGASSAAVPCC